MICSWFLFWIKTFYIGTVHILRITKNAKNLVLIGWWRNYSSFWCFCALFLATNGANFFDVVNQLLYVTIRGSEPVDIETVPAVIVAFNFPAVSVDDFFEENLISNLALYVFVFHRTLFRDRCHGSCLKWSRPTSRSSTSTFVISFDEPLN